MSRSLILPAGFFLFAGINNLGKVTLFFGCRLKSLDLYREEKQKMLEENVLDEVHLALSREPDTSKVSLKPLEYLECRRMFDFFFSSAFFPFLFFCKVNAMLSPKQEIIFMLTLMRELTATF